MTKQFILLCALLLLCMGTNAQNNRLNILMIGAHPDDCDIKGGGTAALFAEMGHRVKFIAVTNGDAGHHEMGGGLLAKRRTQEAREAGRQLGIDEYEVLDHHDGELMPTLEIRKELIRKIREWQADVVISHRTNDYHPDHRYTGVLVQDAAFMVGVPNIAADVPPLRKNPVFLYFEDGFQRPNPFAPDITVDVTSVIDKKVAALDAHESQFYEWLPWISNYKGTIPTKQSDRKAWIKEQRWKPLNIEKRNHLEKWYSPDQASKAQYVESFEICEYGSQPNMEEIRTLFPMLGK